LLKDYMSGWNQSIIDEFRANQGRVGGPFQGAPLLLLHTTGAKTGRARINPVMYQAVGKDFAVFASKGGASANPAWYQNLIANPLVTIEVGTQTLQVKARGRMVKSEKGSGVSKRSAIPRSLITSERPGGRFP
jgi:deazaflavin-dependent oxidoreductase (nitroreductase family)